MKATFIIIFYFISFECLSQNQLYVHNILDKRLFLVDIDNCTAKVMGNMPQIMYDLAMSPNGQLYGLSANEDLYLLDSKNGNGVLITTYNFKLNSLVYGSDGFLYAASLYGNIYKIDPNNGNTTLLGNCGYGSGGDLTFYEGILYLSGRNGELVKINLPDVSKSKLVGFMSVPNIFGIITVGSFDCSGNKPKVFAMGDNELFEIDLTNAKVKKVCSLPIYSIGGAASITEAYIVPKKLAGKDSSLSICYKSANTIDLNQYLRENDTGGIWTDIDKTNYLKSNGTLSPSNLKSGTYRFEYTVGTGICIDNAVIKIEVKDSIKIDKLILKSSDCDKKNGSIQMNVTNSASMVYSINAMSFQNSSTFNNLENGDYKIKIRTQLGCELDTTVKLIPPPLPQITNIETKETTCNLINGSIKIIATGGSGRLQFSYDKTNFTNNYIFDNVNAGDYDVVVKDSLGCTSSKTVQIASSSKPKIVQIEAIPTGCEMADGKISIESEGGVMPLLYSIDNINFISNPSFTNLTDGNYEVFVKDNKNCIDSRKVILKTNCKNILLIPKAFSPNNDGSNDFLEVYFPRKTVKITHFEVFNRWSSLVFSIYENITIVSGQKIWNGQDNNGISLMQGIYSYSLSVEFEDGENQIYQGAILIAL